MKKFFTFISIALCSWLIYGCQESDSTVSLESVTLDSHELTLEVGEQEILTATASPEGIEGLVFEWISLNSDIASVNQDGVVTAKAAGNTVITVSCQGISDVCSITVNPAADLVESVTISEETLEVLIGESETLTATVLPADADVDVTWTSSNPDVATVDNNGVVKGIASGSAVIMAIAGNRTDDCMVTVVGMPVTSVTLDQQSIEIDEGEIRTLRATVLPENADNKSVTWSSSDEKIATVNGAGAVQGVRPGTATITAKAGNCTATCEVTVNAVALAVGHYYYSDGTWSLSLDAGKTPIGVVCYVGDITATDPTLKRDHPGCTHGLVVSLKDIATPWQSNYTTYGSTIGAWVEANATEFVSPLTGVEFEDNLNTPIGYNNTKAIEAFNADPANSTWPVEAVQTVVAFRDEVSAPESSSDWYLGSSKEMSLLATGEYNKNIWEITDAGVSTANLKLVNDKMEQIPGAVLVGKAFGSIMFYWTSTEIDETTDGYPVMAGMMLPMNGMTLRDYKDQSAFIYCIRPVLAF